MQKAKRRRVADLLHVGTKEDVVMDMDGMAGSPVFDGEKSSHEARCQGRRRSIQNLKSHQQPQCTGWPK